MAAGERTAGTSWDPAQYAKFGGERLRPALELLARVPLEAPREVVDLGCGTGEVTRAMAARWPEARVTGLDHSDAMLERARAADRGGAAGIPPNDVIWGRADIATWTPAAPPDLIYSNAALHWLDGHRDLFPRLARFLARGGCLAVQMPRSWGLPSHRLMRETLAGGGPGGTPLGTRELRASLAREPVHEPRVYHDLLAPGARRVDIWETEYLQVLAGEDPVLEWVRGTGLRPVLDALAGQERERFLDEYRRRLRQAYPVRSDGTTLYPFRRLFIVAVV